MTLGKAGPSAATLSLGLAIALGGGAGLAAGCGGCGGGGDTDAAAGDAGPRCGNGRVEGAEECDDAILCDTDPLNGVTDGCGNDCRLETLASVSVNTSTQGSQIFPIAIAMPNGFGVAYQDTVEGTIEDDSEIRMRLYDLDGGPWTAGGPFAPGYDFRVTSFPGNGPQTTPGASVCADGSFAVAWGDFRPPNGTTGAVRARFFAPDGTPGDDVVISDVIAAGHVFGSGLAGGCLNGAHFFVWVENVMAMPPAPGGSVLRGRVLDTAGVPLATDAAGGADVPFDVEPNLLAGPTQPSVAVDAITNIVWVAYRSLAPTQVTGADVFLRRLTGSFGTLGGVDVVDGTGEVAIDGPQVAVAGGAAGAMIVWTVPGSTNTVHARLYDALANPRPPLGSVSAADFAIDTMFSTEESLPSPHVAALADETFLITWVDLTSGVVGLHVDADGAGVGPSPLMAINDMAACVLVRGPVAYGFPDAGYVAAWETTSPTADDNECGQVGCGVRARAMRP
ncbi:MAG TPA: hypothetical protein VG389_27755 [Myxococcota bacterium]|jgi:hypothetical protein|nr:hypothetical protein [Myxococcota bacterium]